MTPNPEVAIADSASVGAWDLLVRRGEPSATTVVTSRRPDLTEGRVRLAVERYGVSANNVTYALVGGSSPVLSWLEHFPAREGFVRVPVWGFATIVESRHPDHAVGSQVFGYLPMSTDVDVTPQPFEGGFLDVSTHRVDLPEFYRRLVTVGGPEDLDGLRTLVRPVFSTSFFLADVVDQQVERAGGPVTVLVTSASSKTALGTAHLLRERGRAATHGLTSSANIGFVAGTGLYDAASTYDDLPDLAPGTRVVLLDFSGRRSVLTALHERYADALVLHQAVGGTAQEAPAHDPNLPGPAPQQFDAVSVHAQYLQRLGERRLADLVGEAETGFLQVARRFLSVRDSVGPDAAPLVWNRALTGGVAPDVVEVVHPREPAPDDTTDHLDAG